MRTHADIVAVAAATVVCAGVAVVGAPWALSFAFGAALVLVLPGCAITEALWGRELDSPARLVAFRRRRADGGGGATLAELRFRPVDVVTLGVAAGVVAIAIGLSRTP